ncbi:WG containing repeat-containing protein [Janthinobacterium sp. OK676]|uniref:WG repeat-containing protein n=1 Tax=unclassified Janthinobacterium TaxID=2610881 RepID=UPI00087FA299|nr:MULTISPECIES: WG repeat-containing protein [unclassified Janthinobacterium]PJJ18159.1 WG repeat protein [Janthinobacterium sp. 67]SDL57726.1 WG containing repeat-containing protein [Janthinobacterium sp. OK676]
MINTAALFSTTFLPGQAGFDTDTITGLAEWRLDVPMLFKLLVGAGTQAVAWPIYGDGEDCPCVLAAPMAQAQASWQALSSLMDKPRDAAAIVARGAISALLAGGQPWLILDGVQLIPHDIGTPAYVAGLDALRAEAQALHSALLRDERDALAPLLAIGAASPATGYWSATADAQLADVEELGADELPFLQGLEVVGWEEDALCYEVSAAGEPDVTGLVTPYGRWIVPLSQRYVDLGVYYADDGWITFATADAPDAHGVMDLNGTVVLPPAPGALYVISPHLLQRIDPDGASRLLRLPDGALLIDRVDNMCEREDGLIDIERQTAQIDDDDKRNVHGVVDKTGKVVVPLVYNSVHDFGTRKKIAIVSLRIAGRFLFGLIDNQGELLAPCQYEAIDCATTSSPPKLRKNLIFAIDAQGLACMLTLDGKQAFTPQYPPAHHLRGVTVQSDFLYVVKDGMAWSMDFTGQLLEQFDTVDNFKAAITAQLSEAMGLGKKKPAKRRSFTPAQILAKADRGQLRSMAALLVLSDADLAARCVDITLEALAEDDPEEEYEGDTPEAACFFLLWSTAADVLGHGTTLDWKAVDEVPRIAQHIDLPALQDFRWADQQDGDAMAEGLAAIAAHLAPHQLRLVNLQDGEDTYYLGVVRVQDAEAFKVVALQAALRPVLL